MRLPAELILRIMDELFPPFRNETRCDYGVGCDRETSLTLCKVSRSFLPYGRRGLLATISNRDNISIKERLDHLRTYPYLSVYVKTLKLDIASPSSTDDTLLMSELDSFSPSLCEVYFGQVPDDEPDNDDEADRRDSASASVLAYLSHDASPLRMRVKSLSLWFYLPSRLTHFLSRLPDLDNLAIIAHPEEEERAVENVVLPRLRTLRLVCPSDLTLYILPYAPNLNQFHIASGTVDCATIGFRLEQDYYPSITSFKLNLLCDIPSTYSEDYSDVRLETLSRLLARFRNLRTATLRVSPPRMMERPVNGLESLASLPPPTPATCSLFLKALSPKLHALTLLFVCNNIHAIMKSLLALLHLPDFLPELRFLELLGFTDVGDTSEGDYRKVAGLLDPLGSACEKRRIEIGPGLNQILVVRRARFKKAWKKDLSDFRREAPAFGVDGVGRRVSSGGGGDR
ncbi:hypothetical protein P7C70_g2962, partial [Phenoliferia sp. Uapishka_3]